MKNLIALLLLVFFTTVGSAQANLTSEEVIELTNIKNEIDGTYQIQLVNTRFNPSIQLSLFKEIKEARHQSEVRYIQISDNYRVFIPSYDEISKPEFIPLDYLGSANSNQK